MEITHKRLNRVDLLTLTGRLDAASSPQLREHFDRLLDEGRNRIVLDMTGVDHLSSAGLRVLVEGRNRSRDPKLTDLAGGDVRLAGMSPRLKELFQLTGLLTLFPSYPDAVEAVGSF